MTRDQAICEAVKRLNNTVVAAVYLPLPKETTQAQYQTLRKSIRQDAEALILTLNAREHDTYGPYF